MREIGFISEMQILDGVAALDWNRGEGRDVSGWKSASLLPFACSRYFLGK